MLINSGPGTMTESSTIALPAPPLSLLSEASLFLDFDGTLVGVEARPEDVVVSPPLRLLMSRLQGRLGKRVAIISGRPSEQINAMFGGVNFAIAGNHGLEIRWPDGRTVEAQPPANLEDVMLQANRLADRYPGVIVERKRFGVALHYRLAPLAETDCRAVATTLGEKTGLQIQSGKMVIELKAPWANKGTALSLMMSEADMAGTVPIFVGDDETDESGFEAARRLGGAGILVGPPRRTAAAYGLPDVDSTRRWLEAGADAQ